MLWQQRDSVIVSLPMSGANVYRDYYVAAGQELPAFGSLAELEASTGDWGVQRWGVDLREAVRAFRPQLCGSRPVHRWVHLIRSASRCRGLEDAAGYLHRHL